MKGLRLIATGGALPGRTVTNEELSRTVDTSDEWITTRTGIRTRHYCTEGENAATLAIAAAKQALQRSGLAPADIACCVCATLSAPDATPSVACQVQAALALPENRPALDVNAACSGFLYGTAVARGLLATLGGQYALIAIGYTMVYGILRLINFAHGDVFMAAGLIMVYLSASLPIGVALPLMILLTVLLGFVIERAAYKPLRSAPRMSVMISAIGVSYLLQNLATYITGGLPQMYPSLPGLSSQITIAGTSTKMVTVITPFLVVALVVVLTQLINHTKIGMAMRAASRDFETAQLMGIKINNIISFTFVIGSFLAAVGSALYFTNYPSIVPLSGSLPGLRAFVAAVFGGIGSIPGAVVGAFLIGLSETVIKSSNWSVFSDAFTFALLIIILVVKPTGLFGEKSTDKV